MNRKMRHVSPLLALLAIAFSMMGQTISSSLRGSLVDPAGAVVPHAKVSLTNEATRAALEAASDAGGSFVFPNVLAGTYTLRVEAVGFQSLEIRSIVVSAGETRALGALKLQLGDVRQTVSLTAQGAPVQLASSERSAVITAEQIQNIALVGRDFFALLPMVPGVVDAGTQRRETTAPSANAGVFINGGRQNQKNVTFDGITALDTGSNQNIHFEPNMDAIAEIKILASNYQAEFGRNSGGVITVTTKSGSRSFHGTAYDFYRHESLNANSFFNNRAGSNADGTPKAPKNPYRYRISGFSIGGPVYVPRTFNTSKSRFFFFFSQEYVGTKKDYGTRYFNMPTDPERNGDFSRSVDSSGAPIRVIDPQTGRQFPGNIIPADRINRLGQAILNYFPKPNYVETADPRLLYSRNYKTAYSGDYPKRDDVIRIDASLPSNLQIFWRYVKDTDEQRDPTLNGNYFLTPSLRGQPGRGQTVHITRGFSPTLVNEFLFGKSHGDVYWEPIDKAVVERSRMGNPPLWFKHTNPNMNYISSVSFGGQPSNTPSAGAAFYRNWNDIYSFLDNVGKAWGPHNLKAGIYIERTGKVQFGAGNYKGMFNFSRNPTNPFDSGHSFANALLGNFYSYQEITDPPDNDWWFWNVEWYLQDNWKVSRRLTLDIGLRFYHLPPTEDLNRKTATFDPRYYDPAKAAVLYVPARNPATGQRMAQDPISKAYGMAPLIGQYVPGSGDYANGMRVGGKDGYPPGLFTTAWLTLGPRFGFAYDLFGDGTAAIRGGFGMFRDRPQGNPSYSGNSCPPVAYSAAQFYGNLDTYAQIGGALGPPDLNTLLGGKKLASTMNFSLGLQRRIWETTIDVAYVGGLSRHLLVRRNMNPIPVYARFDPKNQDPTQPGSPLADNFLRPYRGVGNILVYEFSGTSNYNALQVSASRRYARGLQLGVAYTRSKTLGVAPDDYTAVSPYFAPRQRNYGPLAYDRPNMFALNYIYDLPKLGARTGFRPARWVLDNWQISGITAFATGAPFTVGSGTQDTADITGSDEGARVTVIGNPELSKSERTFYRFFNTAAFARTPVRNFGNGGVNYLYGPGANNWDLAVSKRVPLGGEGRYVQFRTEMFNAWNHTQFAAVGTNPAFGTSASGAKPTNPTFGVVAGARDPRMIQLSLKLYF